MVGVDRHVRTGEEDLQAPSAFARIGQRLGEWVSGPQTLTLELALDPVEEHLDLRLETRSCITTFSICLLRPSLKEDQERKGTPPHF